jgi:hypothetical protein
MALTGKGVGVMAVWQVKTRGKVIYFGDKKRKKLTPSACNEPFKGRFWCPRKKWFFKEPCPFMNRRECNNYQVMCGAL